MYRFDDVVVDPSNVRVTVKGEVRGLEPKSFRLLQFLIENRDRAVSKDEILAAVWPGVSVTDNALTRAVAQIRKALDDDPKEARYIETVPTVGYRFVPKVLAESETVEAVAAVAGLGFPWRVVAVGLAAVLVIAAGAAVWKKAPSPGTANSLRATQYTSGDGLDIELAFSTDGKLAAWASDRSGAFEIYIRSTNSTRDRKLTDNWNENLFPSFAPDGQAVAFSSIRQPGIYRVSTLGGPPRRLTSFGARPVWSPDGKWIVFCSRANPSMGTTDYYHPPQSTLWLVAAEGGEPRQITTDASPVGGQGFPSWSPDSTEVRFANYVAAECAMWTYRLRDGKLRKLFASTEGGYGSATFTRDGENLFYIVAKLNGDISIWRQRLDPSTLTPAGPPTALYQPGVGVPRDLTLSPDGKWLAFTAVVAESKLMMLRMEGDAADPHGPVALTHEVSYRFVNPRLSPDGKRLAYSQLPKGGRSNVRVKDLTDEDAESNSVGSDTEAQFNPRFSADGGSVRYMARRMGAGMGIFESVGLADGSVTSLGEVPAGASQPVFSPDGEEVVFNDINENVLHVWKMNLKTRVLTQLTSGPVSVAYPQYSRDGKRLFVQISGKDGQQEIGMMPAAGGPVEKIKEGGVNFAYSSSPDDSKVVYAGLADGIWNLYWVSVKTHEVRQLTHYERSRTYVRYPDWQAGKVVFEFNDPRGNVYFAAVGK